MSELLLLDNSGRQNSARKSTWQRKTLAISILVVVLLIIAVSEGLSFFWFSPAIGDSISFTCSSILGNQTCTINARIDLMDGMNQEEALEVANKVFLKAYKQPIERWALQSLCVNSTCDEKGVWTVCFICLYNSRYKLFGTAILRRSFTVNVNPYDQTAMYGG